MDVFQDIWDGNLETVKQKLKELPKDKKIITVCNAGVTAQKASGLLESLGYDTSVLEGGMKGWNALHESIDVLNENDLLLKQIIRPGKGCLSYLIGSIKTKQCFIVDPSQYAEEYIELANELGMIIEGVIDTHVHADHISGAKLLTELTKTKYYVSRKDFNGADFINLNGQLKIGDNTIKVIETPGHTDGSVCLLINNKALLTGDTLFLEGVGRPDLGRGIKDVEKGASTLYSTLHIIRNLDPDLEILPTHFSNYNTFPISKKLGNLENHALKIDSDKKFIDYILNNLPVSPPNYEQIKEINKTWSPLPREDAERLEFGPNRCASK